MSTHQYSATATREGAWWVVEVDDIGTTQGRSVAEARHMAADMVAAMLDVSIADVEVAVTFELDEELGEEVQSARQATREAEQAQAAAARAYRQAIAAMKEAGFSGVDIAAILDLSPQRVSQLAKTASQKPQRVSESVAKRGVAKVAASAAKRRKSTYRVTRSPS